ncbi:MAG: hypothetical protein HKN50_10925 [Gammaproteobacteria bacterium]|nr:hypothetical protein [Gammaproteobacteria bacterium]
MRKLIQSISLLAIAFPITGYSDPAKVQPAPKIAVDQCAVKAVVAEPGIRQFQFDGLSPDGSQMVVGWDRGDQDRGAYILDLASGERTPLPPLNNVGSFAPDGKTIVASVYLEEGKNDIIEYDLASGQVTPIAPHPNWEWSASYSSDGQSILFNSYREGTADIYSYSKKSAKLKRWTSDPGYEAHAQFSPDDTKILYNAADEDQVFNLFLIDTASGAITQLTDYPTEESYGSWHPSGNTIVFGSDRGHGGGKTDLFLMNSDGSNIRQLTNHPKKDAYPFFSPDGKTLYFNSDREPEGVYKIEFDENLQCVTQG